MSNQIGRKYITDQMRAELGRLVDANEAANFGLAEVAKRIRNGEKIRKGDLLAQKIVDLALDPKKANQWAVEMVYDRMEGRVKPTDDPLDKNIERERELDDITADNINLHTGISLQDDDPPDRIGEQADGRAGRRIDLPSKRFANHQIKSQEPSLASEFEETGER